MLVDRSHTTVTDLPSGKEPSMSTKHVGADADCSMAELAVENRRMISGADAVAVLLRTGWGRSNGLKYWQALAG